VSANPTFPYTTWYYPSLGLPPSVSLTCPIDPCNNPTANTNCASCQAYTVGGVTCGWCSNNPAIDTGFCMSRTETAQNNAFGLPCNAPATQAWWGTSGTCPADPCQSAPANNCTACALYAPASFGGVAGKCGYCGAASGSGTCYYADVSGQNAGF